MTSSLPLLPADPAAAGDPAAGFAALFNAVPGAVLIPPGSAAGTPPPDFAALLGAAVPSGTAPVAAEITADVGVPAMPECAAPSPATAFPREGKPSAGVPMRWAPPLWAAGRPAVSHETAWTGRLRTPEMGELEAASAPSPEPVESTDADNVPKLVPAGTMAWLVQMLVLQVTEAGSAGPDVLAEGDGSSEATGPQASPARAPLDGSGNGSRRGADSVRRDPPFPAAPAADIWPAGSAGRAEGGMPVPARDGAAPEPMTRHAPGAPAHDEAPDALESEIPESAPRVAEGEPPARRELPARDSAPVDLTDAPFAVRGELVLPNGKRVEATITLPARPAAPSEKIAAHRVDSAARLATRRETAEKNFLPPGMQKLRAEPAIDGIGVAEPPADMSAVPTAPHRAFEKPELTAVVPAVDFADGAAEAPTPAVEPAVSAFARRAVETVTGLAEAQFAARHAAVSTVSLRLKFAGADLAVRVELRDGAVHTQFRTDSADLRAALAQEWQAVAADPAAHVLRFLEPVFNASPADSREEARSLAGGGTGGAPHERPAPHADPAASSLFAVRPRANAASPVGPADAGTRRPSAPPTAIHLSVHA